MDLIENRIDCSRLICSLDMFRFIRNNLNNFLFIALFLSLSFSFQSQHTRSPIASADAEMTLKQFASITELLTKLRADLRQSFQR
jgi:hypothetical protein